MIYHNILLLYNISKVLVQYMQLKLMDYEYNKLFFIKDFFIVSYIKYYQ